MSSPSWRVRRTAITSFIALSLATQAMAEEAGIQSGAELLVACSPTYTTPQNLYDQCLNFTVNEIGKLNLPETAVISDGQRIPAPPCDLPRN